MDRVAQRKMLVLANGNKFEIDRQKHNSTSNVVSANSLIVKFIRYDASSIVSLCVTLWAVFGIFWSGNCMSVKTSEMGCFTFQIIISNQKTSFK